MGESCDSLPFIQQIVAIILFIYLFIYLFFANNSDPSQAKNISSEPPNIFMH